MDFGNPTDTPNTNNTDDITQLVSIFDLLDLENNGDLDFPEFKVGLTSIGVNLTQDEAIALFDSIDAENEEFINREMFLEWLSKPSTSKQMDIIRNKLKSALAAAQEINNPLQDMEDEDEIAHLLGNKPEYIQEIEDIKNDTGLMMNDDGNNSNDTTKINASDDDENSQSDSLNSEERREIMKAKQKQQRRNSKKFAQNELDSADDLETSLMQQQMVAMMKQQKYALDREVSNRNILREDNANKWNPEEIGHELDAMNKQLRRLSQVSLSVDQIQEGVNKTMEECRKMSGADNGPPVISPSGQIISSTVNTVNEIVTGNNNKDSISDMSHNADTVGVPSRFDADYDIMIDDNVERSINNKNIPQKMKIDTLMSPTNMNGTGSNNVSPRPIQEITTTGTPHTTSSQAVMISGGGSSQNNSQNNSRRGSLSYSMHSVSQSHGNNYNSAAYTIQNQGMTDISQYTATQPMQQQLIRNNNNNHTNMNGIAHHNQNNNNNNNNNANDSNGNILKRLFSWYLAPMHQKESLRRLWYHGANAVLSIVICAIMLSLLIFAIAFIPLCGIGLIFIYFMCLLARHFAIVDSTFSYYFFGNKLINRFSIFIPKSHQQSIIGALKEYITDPHILQVIVYFTFIKLPAAFTLSGITMVIFSGVSAVLLSPLIYWLDKPYFDAGLYCILGSKQYENGTVTCNGWQINSFTDSVLAFVPFVIALPLTLHLSNFTAKLLIRITLNFLSINSPNSPHSPPMINKMQKQQLNKQHNVNVNYSLSNNGGYR